MTEISFLPFYSADATTKLARALLVLQTLDLPRVSPKPRFV